MQRSGSYDLSSPGNGHSFPPSADPDNKAKTLEDKNAEGGDDGRGEWGSQCDFILSCIGFAVGLGNVWRFPYLCYKNGGGAFLIPYVIMLFICGLPLFCLELTIGQYVSLGPNKLFQKLSPLFSGLGYGMLLVTFMVTCYYNMFIAWSIFYSAASFTSKLGWSNCKNDYNTINCYTVKEERECLTDTNNTSLFWNRTCYPIADYCTHHGYTQLNATACTNNDNSSIVKLYDNIGGRISASEDYYSNYMLGLKDHTWDDYGGLKWDVCLCLLAAWLIVWLCLIKGVKSSGKVVYFTALFPYFVLLILMVRGVTLDGALDGIKFYITPDLSRLSDSGVWSDAATQIFFSLGPGFGGLITLASYNKFNNNCMRDAIVVSFTNCATSVFAGFVVFSILGFMAKQLGKEVTDVIASGSGLAYIAYPEAVVHMPISPLWAILFFAMLITLGLDSQFTMVETLNTAMLDQWPKLRNWKGTVIMVTSIVGFFLGLSMCANGGIYMFTLIDSYSASWSLLMIAITELVVVAWVFGAEKMLVMMESEMGIYIPKVLRWYWFICWKFLAPVVLVVVLVFSFVQYVPAYYGNDTEKYVFPAWVDAMGLAMATVPACLVLIGGVYMYFSLKKKGYSVRDMLVATPEWCPASQRNKNALAMAPVVEKYATENSAFDAER